MWREENTQCVESALLNAHDLDELTQNHPRNGHSNAFLNRILQNGLMHLNTR